MPFKFKFQSILDIKIQIEDSLKNELGKAVQRLEHEKELLRNLEGERDGNIDEFNSRSSKGIRVEKIREYTAYLSYLKDVIRGQKENINVAQGNVDKYREQLIEALQEREMLDKLKEKHYQEYQREQLKKEQQVNDEVVSFNYMPGKDR